MPDIKKKIYRLTLSAMFLSMALVLPVLTGQIPQIGNMLCPMHFPVLLCGFFCGPLYAFAVGLIAPLMRSVIFGVPPLIPKGICMCLELATYGLVSGLLYRKLPQKPWNVYVSLVSAMLCGRIVWGCSRTIFYRFGKLTFTWTAFFASGFVTAVPGIVLQLILIPALVLLFNKYTAHKNA